MACWEGGLPYGLKMMCDGLVETIGEMVFDGSLKNPFTAHPKRDPVTGKLYGFGYQVCPPRFGFQAQECGEGPRVHGEFEWRRC